MTTASAREAGLGDLAEEHESFRESLRTHLERVAVPQRERWAAQGSVPGDVLTAAAAHGFTAMAAPEEAGGLGVDDLRFSAIVLQEAARAGLTALGLVLLGHGDLPARALRAAPGEAMLWLRAIVDGELRAATALDTPDLRLDDGGAVHGRQPAVVGGADADLLVLAVRRDAGQVLVAVATDDPAVRRGTGAAPVGLAAAGLAEVELDGARATVLEGADVEALVADERLLLAVASVAAGRAALATTVAYVTDRRAFGTPISGFQNTRQLLGQAAAELEAAEAHVERCLARRTGAAAADGADAAAVKLHAAEVLGRVVDAGVQLHGGYGYMLEYPIARAFADARFLRLHGGSTQRLRDEVAVGLLGG
ncbi:acyl-CoA dehydrogenase family protein [Conexibacter sp. SYSU D00693]|uniref:acyl-CoA dehydrogenase family protein n=1 Tax=Conexibacter sp. SYSU D00693 TaxID=2812560 RepID=UPI00196AADE2|nr:acyl-CoA dehydrogenase family protein [Conexibacter sp. SYSU D00693]